MRAVVNLPSRRKKDKFGEDWEGKGWGGDSGWCLRLRKKKKIGSLADLKERSSSYGPPKGQVTT